EWEYACRAGTITIFHFGDDPSRLEDYAWFRDNTWAVGARHPHRVAQKKPNAFGLFDMHGNVSEWCQPGVVVSSVMHRGGNWESNAWSCRSACRYGNFRDGRSHRMGFRVVKDSPTE
ncbi:MAG: SUMF1/EgtB/PvdO family nonheme iron enzyme, partial [Candidatus Anammoximicrobium sp.]|nr:SUMF1/EgtB/PvdO family nonheme iron enzyme [Candidatus Anammoximicrobium sp.]